MNKCLLLATMLFSAASVAQAQVRFSIGPQAAYNLASVNYSYDNGSATYTTSYRSGFAAGVTADIGLGHFAIQPAVQFAQKGYNLTTTYPYPSILPNVTNTQVRLNYLAVPVNVAYTQHRNGQGAQVFAGPYLGVLLGGHYTDETTYSPSFGKPNTTLSGKVVAAESFTPSFSDENSYSRRVDAGLQFGLGYRYQGLLLQATYSLGLTNQASVEEQLPGGSSYASPTYHNRAFQLSLAYLFGANH